MSDTPKHTKITTYEELPDGSFKKKTVKYHELMAAIEEERVKNIPTDKERLLADLMQAIRVITEGKTNHLSIDIEAREFGQPSMIVQTYTTYRQNFKKR